MQADSRVVALPLIFRRNQHRRRLVPIFGLTGYIPDRFIEENGYELALLLACTTIDFDVRITTDSGAEYIDDTAIDTHPAFYDPLFCLASGAEPELAHTLGKPRLVVRLVLHRAIVTDDRPDTCKRPTSNFCIPHMLYVCYILMSRQKEDPVFNRVEELRTMKGLSRQQLADTVGVHYQTIGYLERGEYSPSLILALKIAKALDAEIPDIFSIKPFRKGS